MSADYACPRCSGRLANGAGVNVYRCRQCGETVVEAMAESYQRVRRFYERATSQEWGGLYE